jgi:NMD protein affecting ribosome stability and mRNA decay
MNDICQGNSIHECLTCKEAYLCYACPDTVNVPYSEGMCPSCLEKMLAEESNPRGV